jgi:Flp pilus assembly protein TadG
LFIPVLLAALGLLAGLGAALHTRQLASIAADLGALAGAQCLDLERLASGQLIIVAEHARAAAVDYATRNLPGRVAAVEVTVMNPALGAGADPWSGRVHSHATVCVVVRLPARFRLGPIRWEHVIHAHADASVVPR